MDKRLAFLLNNSSDILCVTDISGNIISVNNSWVHFTGNNPEESKGKNIFDLSHPSDRNKLTEVFSSISALREIEGLFIRVNTSKSGFLTISWSLCFDPDKQLVYAVGIYVNEDLHIRNPYNISDKVQHMLVNLTEGFFMLDSHWRVNAFNPAFQKLVKMSVDELYGIDFRLIDKLMITDAVIYKFENAWQSGQPGELQYYDSNCKGWLRVNIYPYKGELLVFIRDISQIKIEQLILTLEKRVLELNFVQEYPLSKITDELLIGIESIFPEMYCSVLEVDEAQEKIYHLSAPRLPPPGCTCPCGPGSCPSGSSLPGTPTAPSASRNSSATAHRAERLRRSGAMTG